MADRRPGEYECHAAAIHGVFLKQKGELEKAFRGGSAVIISKASSQGSMDVEQQERKIEGMKTKAIHGNMSSCDCYRHLELTLGLIRGNGFNTFQLYFIQPVFSKFIC